MTTLKIAQAPETSDGVPVVVRTQLLDKTQELPALTDSTSQAEPEASNKEAVPRDIDDGDVTVPVRCSIESTLTFEVLRLQSAAADEEEKP